MRVLLGIEMHGPDVVAVQPVGTHIRVPRFRPGQLTNRGPHDFWASAERVSVAFLSEEN